MKKPLLIEIGVEELPALPFLKELPNIKNRWDAILKAYSLFADFKFYYTPRRLVLICDDFLDKQADSTNELFGAPISIAFKDGEPTPAALGFAKKCGVSLDEIKRVTKNGKEVLYFEKKIKGKNSCDLLEPMIVEFLKALNFGKSMRWGDNKESFIRPIRWIGLMFASQIIEIEAYGVKSSNKTYGHRSLGFEPLSYNSIDKYLKILKNSSVILNQKQREKIVREQFKTVEKKQNITIDLDEELLKEVVAITEYPTALYGSFDKKFLKLPPEVIIVSMKEHQRYFPVFKDDKLSEHFVFVSNADSSDFGQIIRGNEKVLLPRLSDGLFFYKNDIKNGLNNEALNRVSFMDGLGSIYDKSVREEKIAQYLFDLFVDKPLQKSLLNQAVMYAKADLLSDMVYEFTELQGLMGYYYASQAGWDASVCLAFKEQYLPDGEDSLLPSSDFSAVVALSYKLDSILALFSKGKIPTGTKDPFALRRAALGVIKIVLDREFAFDLGRDLEILAKDYDDFDTSLLERFFLERMASHIDANPSVIQAVLKSGEKDILQISKKIDALNEIVKKDSFKESFSTFKRVANIIKDVNIEDSLTVDKSLLEEKAELSLYESYLKVSQVEYKSYKENLDVLFSLKGKIDNFFDEVMVNVEDEKVKNNRKNLIALIYKEFKNIADIKEITV